MITKLAGCILLDARGRIGLLHRNKKGITQWELPGGKVEPNERDEEAAIRELQEELGVTVRIEKEIGSTSFESSGAQYEYAWFLAGIEKGSPRVCEPDTFDDFRYVTLRELEELELSGNMQQFFRQLKAGKISLPIH